MPNFKNVRVTAMKAVLGGAMTAGIISLGLCTLKAQDTPEKPISTTPVQTETQVSPPKTSLSLEDRADIFMARKSFDDAIDYYQRALNQPGLSPEAKGTIWNKLGIAYQELLDFGQARKAYKESTRLRPDFGEPWNNLGTTYYMADKVKASVKYYTRAIKDNPNSSSFHMNLGTSYYKMKKYKEAVDEFQIAFTLDPNILAERSLGGTVMQTRGADASFYYLLAKTFARQGRASEAVRYLRRAFEEGFKDRKRLEDDADLKKISQNPEYIELLKNPPVSIRD
jgi:tetratricopeptide (TPR) repeat protein